LPSRNDKSRFTGCYRKSGNIYIQGPIAIIHLITLKAL
jgi:hypothetical protein